MKNKKIVAIIQARVGSTRLPRKVLKELKGKSILYHVVERVKQSKVIDDIIIATSDLSKDDDIVKEAESIGVGYFRGSELDVLNRYYRASQENNADIVVRITSDCPLIDSKIIDEMLAFYLNNNYEVVTNTGIDISNRTYPRGLDTEIFSFESLEKANLNSTEEYQREHVTPYIYENINSVYYYKNETDYSKYRLTIDTIEDYQLIKEIYSKLYFGSHNFYLNDIVSIMTQNPYLYEINKNIEQKETKNKR